MQKWLGLLISSGLIAITACTPNPANPNSQTPTTKITQVSTPTHTSTINQVPAYTSTTLEIIRNGKKYSVLLGYDTGQAFWYTTPQPQVNLAQWYGDIRNITSANIQRYGDLDHDGEIEYLVSADGRGASVYMLILAVDYDRSKDEYRIFDELSFRASGFDRWDDIEKDGIPEIIGKDESYHYASGGTGADSLFSPIKIFHYNGQKFTSVTREYPGLIEQDAKYWLGIMNQDALEQGQFGSIYASYLADMYLFLVR